MLVDKPAGPTSHDVVAHARRAFLQRAVGHTGTLDPFATGLLVVLLGRATRLARFVERQDKTYLAAARLGAETDTDDATGTVVRTGAATWPDRDEVAAAVGAMRDWHEQRPPAYSAKRVAGVRSYALARAGSAPDLTPVPITVARADLVEYEPPRLVFRVTVSAGTYVRALGRDLGRALGTGAHLESLRREAIGTLRVEEAVPLESLRDAPAPLPPLAVLGHLPRVEVSGEAVLDIAHGRSVSGPPLAEGDLACLVGVRGLVAVAEWREGRYHPRVVLEPA